MSNNKNNTIPSGPAAAKLKMQLKEIINELSYGYVPSENVIHELKLLFDAYRDECGRAELLTSHTIQEAYPMPAAKKVIFDDVLPTGKNNALAGSFLEKDENIQLLKQLTMKKLVLDDEIDDLTDSINYLIRNDIAAPVSIDIRDDVIDGYCLTSNGWKQVLAKAVSDCLKEKDAALLLPQKLCSSPEGWNDTTFVRAAIIQLYYVAENIDNYFIFADYTDPKLLLGCKICSSDSSQYCFAAAFDEDTKMQDVARLYDIVSFEKIDELTIIVQSKEDEDELKIQYGLNNVNLHYYVLMEAREA